MEIQTVKAERRAVTGSAAVRRLRREAKVPAVLYGHGEEVVPLAISADAVSAMLDAGHRLVGLELDGKEERALVKDVQFDTWGASVLHVDFARVALDETVEVSVELKLHGQPKEVLGGAVLEQPLRTLDVECKADHIPDEIVVEVGHLAVGQMIHVKDLVLPDGVKALNEPEAIVVVLHEARSLEEVVAPAAEAAEGAAAAEPELIRRAKPEGEEEEGEGKAKS